MGNSTIPPSPKVKARRRADEAVARLRPQHVAGIAVADRQHVAVEMHGALRLARGAGGEADQADIVRRRIDGVELGEARDQRLEAVGLARPQYTTCCRSGARARARSISSDRRWSQKAMVIFAFFSG